MAFGVRVRACGNGGPGTLPADENFVLCLDGERVREEGPAYNGNMVSRM